MKKYYFINIYYIKKKILNKSQDTGDGTLISSHPMHLWLSKSLAISILSMIQSFQVPCVILAPPTHSLPSNNPSKLSFFSLQKPRLEAPDALRCWCSSAIGRVLDDFDLGRELWDRSPRPTRSLLMMFAPRTLFFMSTVFVVCSLMALLISPWFSIWEVQALLFFRVLVWYWVWIFIDLWKDVCFSLFFFFTLVRCLFNWKFYFFFLCLKVCFDVNGFSA